MATATTGEACALTKFRSRGLETGAENGDDRETSSKSEGTSSAFDMPYLGVHSIETIVVGVPVTTWELAATTDAARRMASTLPWRPYSASEVNGDD
ncbi:MAG TPA: hypothetical protein VFA59_23595 [Vicinamibacterales bacterium]|nr:hypothetical protein [Vicinamibacterales bacterium]